jgi:hypothetical protein
MLNILPLFGCTPNNRGDYVFVDGNTPQELALREAAANELRQFYSELKTVKNGSLMVVEYFLNVSLITNKINTLILYLFQHPNNRFSHIQSS